MEDTKKQTNGGFLCQTSRLAQEWRYKEKDKRSTYEIVKVLDKPCD
ncbi:hypothetical protein ACLHDF_29880 [Priestia aryabhattai]